MLEKLKDSSMSVSCTFSKQVQTYHDSITDSFQQPNSLFESKIFKVLAIEQRDIGKEIPKFWLDADDL